MLRFQSSERDQGIKLYFHSFVLGHGATCQWEPEAMISQCTPAALMHSCAFQRPGLPGRGGPARCRGSQMYGSQVSAPESWVMRSGGSVSTNGQTITDTLFKPWHKSYSIHYFTAEPKWVYLCTSGSPSCHISLHSSSALFSGIILVS